jgi:hypothetical protein
LHNIKARFNHQDNSGLALTENGIDLRHAVLFLNSKFKYVYLQSVNVQYVNVSIYYVFRQKYISPTPTVFAKVKRERMDKK